MHPIYPNIYPPLSFLKLIVTYPVCDGAARAEGKALGNGGGEAAHHPAA